jgi:hypothetical protein
MDATTLSTWANFADIIGAVSILGGLFLASSSSGIIGEGSAMQPLPISPRRFIAKTWQMPSR